MLVICATDEEEKMLSKHFTDIIKTGVGYGNVYKALHNLDRNTPILNIGYAGSNKIPIGKICAVGKSMNYPSRRKVQRKRISTQWTISVLHSK